MLLLKALKYEPNDGVEVFFLTLEEIFRSLTCKNQENHILIFKQAFIDTAPLEVSVFFEDCMQGSDHLPKYDNDNDNELSE